MVHCEQATRNGDSETEICGGIVQLNLGQRHRDVGSDFLLARVNFAWKTVRTDLKVFILPLWLDERYTDISTNIGATLLPEKSLPEPCSQPRILRREAIGHAMTVSLGSCCGR